MSRSARRRVKARTVVVLAAACSAASSSSRGAGFQLLELERQLVDQPRRALRPLPVDLALELGDPELLRGDQRHVFRGFRPRDRQLRRDFQAPRALGDQRRLQGGDVVGKSLGSGIHATKGITVFAI